MKYITWIALLNFCLYALSSLALLCLFGMVYMRLTPYKEIEQIRQGSTAPAIALSGALLGFTMPLLSLSYNVVNFVDFLLWSLVAGVFQLVLFKVLYWVIPIKIEEQNNAVAVMYATLALCVGLICAFSLIPS